VAESERILRFVLRSPGRISWAWGVDLGFEMLDLV